MYLRKTSIISCPNCMLKPLRRSNNMCLGVGSIIFDNSLMSIVTTQNNVNGTDEITKYFKNSIFCNNTNI